MFKAKWTRNKDYEPRCFLFTPLSSVTHRFAEAVLQPVRSNRFDDSHRRPTRCRRENIRRTKCDRESSHRSETFLSLRTQTDSHRCLAKKCAKGAVTVLPKLARGSSYFQNRSGIQPSDRHRN